MPKAACLLVAVLLGFAAFASTVSTDRADAGTAALQALIDSAAPGDSITVEGGVYREHIIIDKPLSLVGVGSPIIDGGGEGDVVTIIGAAGVTLSGFEIVGSGRAVSQEGAAIKVVNAHEPAIRSNKIRDSLYGIHVTGSHHATIAFNDIDQGADIPQERRGHGIYLWEVEGAAIRANNITHSGDGIHLEFSDDNGIGQNTVTDSRYALHFMSSDNNRILENTFRDNLAGAVLMFSHDLLLKDNELSNNRKGASGAGMLIKDVDNIFVEGNNILRNKYGITVEGTPNSAGASATFLANTLALNDTGIGLFTNAPITFVENAMIENTVQVQALSGALSHGAAPSTESAPANTSHNGHSGQTGSQSVPTPSASSRPESAVWTLSGRGNYWSDYSGYDANGDGVGDRPYEPRPPFAGGLASADGLRVFQFTVAQQAIDIAADMFPVYEYDAVMRDSGPLMEAPGPALARDAGLNANLLIVSALLLLLSAALLQAFLDVDATYVLGRAVGRLVRLAGRVG